MCAVFLKELEWRAKIWKEAHDYQEGTLVFIAPGAIRAFNQVQPPLLPKVGALCFIQIDKGTSLGKTDA
ncbi:MAG: hypothetical protein IPH94_19005 [Saprospiraceae bacterium]|nr:hypothetical protein [Saprospiraceae bacterium]